MPVQADGLLLAASNIDQLLFLGNAGQRLGGEVQGVESGGGGMELSQATVDQDQVGQGAAFLQESPVAARNHFDHALEVVRPADRLDDEFAVVGLLHSALLPNHHAGHAIRPLNVGDVERLDPLWRVFQVHQLGQSLTDHPDAGIQGAEALVEGQAGVPLGQADQLLLGTSLRFFHGHPSPFPV